MYIHINIYIHTYEKSVPAEYPSASASNACIYSTKNVLHTRTRTHARTHTHIGGTYVCVCVCIGGDRWQHAGAGLCAGRAEGHTYDEGAAASRRRDGQSLEFKV